MADTTTTESPTNVILTGCRVVDSYLLGSTTPGMRNCSLSNNCSEVYNAIASGLIPNITVSGSTS
jgi:hypothetical protein